MIELIRMQGSYSIHRLKGAAGLPEFPVDGGFISVTFTSEEVSVVCSSDVKLKGSASDRRWAGFRVKGILDLTMTGILHRLSAPLAKAGIPVFVISTYNTDYFFVREEDAPRAAEVFSSSGEIRLSGS